MDDWWNSLSAWFTDKLAEIEQWYISFTDEIPHPDWWDDAMNKIEGIYTGQIAFYADLLHVEYGITIILSAYALRFAVRRIPIIG